MTGLIKHNNLKLEVPLFLVINTGILIVKLYVGFRHKFRFAVQY